MTKTALTFLSIGNFTTIKSLGLDAGLLTLEQVGFELSGLVIAFASSSSLPNDGFNGIMNMALTQVTDTYAVTWEAMPVTSSDWPTITSDLVTWNKTVMPKPAATKKS